MTQPVNDRGCGVCNDSVTSLDRDGASVSLRFIADRWPTLPPHVRETIIILVDAVSNRRPAKGGQS